MTTLVLTKTWLNLLADGSAVAAQRDEAEDWETGVQGRIVTYAGGRQRAVTTEGVGGQFGFTLVAVPDTDVATLTDWLGQGVLYRDNRGRRFHGVFFTVKPVAWKESVGTYNVQVVLNFVTVVEGV